MLVNVYHRPLAAIPGTRLLEETFGIVGVRLPDPHDKKRTWMVQGLYQPVRGRVLGGVRAKLTDQKGFITFCNQRDLEVMLGMASPGDDCLWTDTEYVSHADRNWLGFCCDEDDLLDDLFEQEMFLRTHAPGGILYPGLEFERRVHVGHNNDCEELFSLFTDVDPDTGFFPDRRFETLERRWTRSERRRVRWERI